MTEFAERLRATLSQVLPDQVDDLPADRRLADLGLDSVALAEFILALEDELDITLEVEELDGLETVGELEALLRQRASR